MHIFIKIGDNHTYSNHEYKGNFALELALLTIIEVYFGAEIRREVGIILKTQHAEEEFIKNTKEMRKKIVG